MEQAFGRPLEVVFDQFGKQPVASGSIAQVIDKRPGLPTAPRCKTGPPLQ